jgi:hypothetical protein
MAFAGAQPVVAMGDGLVAAAPKSASAPPGTVPGGWVAVLQDCLEERAPGRFSVVDRAAPGETVVSASRRLTGIRELQPLAVVISLGAEELADENATAASFKKDVAKLVKELRVGDAPPIVVLVGIVPPTLAQVSGPHGDQAKIDVRTAEWNAQLAALATDDPGVRVVDLWGDWPKDDGARGALTTAGWVLSDQGHARVAAAICDTVLAVPTPRP